MDPQAFLARALAGDRRALARTITLVEAGHPPMLDALWHVDVRRRNQPGRPHDGQ